MNFRTKYEFSSDVLDVIVSGKSSIDSPNGFTLENTGDAEQFIQSYGYNQENPIEKAEILGNFHEALNFARKHFLQPENPDGLKVEIPRKILELTDIRELLLMASLHYPGQTADTQGQLMRNWACSLLKIMHTIAHIDKDLRSPYFSDIQQQIFDRFYKVVHREGEDLFLGDASDHYLRVALVAFETKPKKSRDSIILKLLHKPENVAEDIFDRAGIRFITHTRLDALRVVKFLKDKMIVMPPNIKPSRSRNTLIDSDFFRTQLAAAHARAGKGDLDEAGLVSELEQAAAPPRVSPDNPHSSEFYRAIQFTGRQLIKLRNPLYDSLKELKSLAKGKPAEASSARGDSRDEFVEPNYGDPKAHYGEPKAHHSVDGWKKTVEKIDLKYIQREVRFFYPFEVQVVDQKSAEENEAGRSAHSEYKRAQVQTALKRVMGSLVDAVR